MCYPYDKSTARRPIGPDDQGAVRKVLDSDPQLRDSGLALLEAFDVAIGT